MPEKMERFEEREEMEGENGKKEGIRGREELQNMIKTAVDGAIEKKCHRVVCIDVKGLCSYTDSILIVSGESDRQVQAIGERIDRAMRKGGWKPLSYEGGRGQGGWVLMDYGDMVVHVFREDLREFYDIEGLWSDASIRLIRG